MTMLAISKDTIKQGELGLATVTVKLPFYLCAFGMDNKVLPGYMDTAVYNGIMHFYTAMWLHFRNVATNMSYKVCSHISEM